ncbi:MAG: NAD(P)H-dependent oxidoreductase subunit E [Chloroflexi bacterium]|nr:NAD(P)H-dependent oxidoreductase subunit E [Chloroflexota bacterium]
MASRNGALRGRIRKAISSQEQKTVTVLSCLLAVEDELGYIPSEAVEEVAEFTGSMVNDVWAVASFYTNFRFTPPGQHVVEVCWGPTCHLSGAPELLRQALEALGLAQEGDTPDGSFTLKFNTCLGACSQAPVIMADHQVVGRASVQQVRALVERLRAARSGEGH